VHLQLRDRRAQRLLHVLTTHLKAKGGPANEAARQGQVQQLLAHLAGALCGVLLIALLNRALPPLGDGDDDDGAPKGTLRG
jgi:hypothetical protein